MGFITTAYTSVEVNAVVYPVCECGKPWAQHGTCGGYKPSRPIEPIGTVAFTSKNLLANLLWKLETLIQRTRHNLLRK